MSFLEIAGISKQFDGLKVLESISLSVDKGEFFSLVGPSGCGKTTLLRIIAGLENPTNGTISLNGEDITNKLPEKRNIGIVFQNYALFPHMNVFNNVAYGLKIRKYDKAAIESKVEDVLRKVKMLHKIKSPVTDLSGGEQQRVSLARVIVNEPELILFDEPLSNLDYTLRIETRRELKMLQHNLGITSVYVTHDQSEALTLSDRMAVMNKGHIMQEGKPEQVYTDPENTFTAEFIGHYNIFSSREFSEIFSVETEDDIKKYAVLPENIVVSKSPNGNCKIISVQFNGFYVEVQAEYNGKVINILNMSDSDYKFEDDITVDLQLRSENDFKILSE